LTHPVRTSLLISTYNWPEALDLVLTSVSSQSVPPNEIIIADDGSTAATRDTVRKWQKKLSIPLLHEWHEDKGFRKTIILNRAIKRSTGEYLIQIDGDIILHKHFIRDHLNNAIPGYFIKGSRGRLAKEKSKKILITKDIDIYPLAPQIKSRFNAMHLPMLSPLLYGDPNNSRTVKGCNFAFWKKDFLSVNGFNNKVIGWGHEDIEIAARLINHGIKQRRLKFSAICYHIYHEILPRTNEQENLKIYFSMLEKGIAWCENGYNQVERYSKVLNIP
jgi:glycosyltransferase involved in cell wall biosynthesis